MNLLSKTEVLAEDKLFATVDATVRKINMDKIPFLLSDTVGFIRKLPTHLIESFKSTLDEIREADILLHVVDVSHFSFEDHIAVVNTTLQDIGAADKPTLLVMNKIDKIEAEEGHTVEEKLEALKEFYTRSTNGHAVFISATNKANIEELKTRILDMVKQKFYTIFPNYLNESY
jgi:GTPase